MIKRNGENLLRLINQILDLAKLESAALNIHYVQGDVLPYLRYIAESLHSLANAQNVMLRVESDQAQIVMDYDPERLLQVVHNLLSNAIKFTPSGGRVTLSVGSRQSAVSSWSVATSRLNAVKREGGRQLERSDIPSERSEAGRQSAVGGRQLAVGSSPKPLPAADCLVLTVKDTGVGIPPEELPHVFDRFFQASNQAQARTGGTGVGLSLAKELVKTMGGEIEVQSEVGKGTTFSVRLPIAHQAPMTSEAPGFLLAPPALSIPTRDNEPGAPLILVVEDNPDVVEYLAACLYEVGDHEGRPYQLDFAYNGRAGIELALEIVPDLIVSDVMMPEKDGFELVETLKNDERTSHIPIVLLTAKATAEDRIAGLRRGADAYLAKPFHQEELLVTIEKLLENRRRMQERYSRLSLSTETPPAAAETEAEDAFMLQLKAYFEKNLSNPELSLDDVCRHMGMGRTNLNLKLKALTNQSAMGLLRLMRLHKAQHLLRTTELNVSEVSFETGFNDPKYFSRVFAEAFGLPPTEWREKMI